jgi:hypothetical protein
LSETNSAKLLLQGTAYDQQMIIQPSSQPDTGPATNMRNMKVRQQVPLTLQEMTFRKHRTWPAATTHSTGDDLQETQNLTSSYHSLYRRWPSGNTKSDQQLTLTILWRWPSGNTEPDQQLPLTLQEMTFRKHRNWPAANTHSTGDDLQKTQNLTSSYHSLYRRWPSGNTETDQQLTLTLQEMNFRKHRTWPAISSSWNERIMTTSILEYRHSWKIISSRGFWHF